MATFKRYVIQLRVYSAGVISMSSYPDTVWPVTMQEVSPGIRIVLATELSVPRPIVNSLPRTVSETKNPCPTPYFRSGVASSPAIAAWHTIFLKTAFND